MAAGFNTVFTNWNLQLLAAFVGLLLVPIGYLASFFELYVQIVVPMKATLNVYMPVDIPTLIIEFLIIAMAGTLSILSFKVSKISCQATLERAKQMMEELDMKIEAIDISTKFVDKTLALAEETCQSYNKLLYIVDMNKTKELDIYDLTRAALARRNTAENLRNELKKSKELIEKSTSHLVFVEGDGLEF